MGDKNSFGRPDSREEKLVTKDIYQRNRSVKRLAIRISQVKYRTVQYNFINTLHYSTLHYITLQITHMPAIPEDVIADMTLATPGHRITFHQPRKHSSGEINQKGHLSPAKQTLLLKINFHLPSKHYCEVR